MRGLLHALSFIAAILSLALAGSAAAGTAEYEIAFASFAPLNGDVFIADSDGSNARPFLAHPEADANPSFSPEGSWIIFSSRRAGSYDIYRARLDGSRLETLVRNRAYDDQAALSPDGKTLAFVSSRSGNADIWLLDMRTRRVRNLTNAAGGDFRPAWSPDGQWIAFSSDRASFMPRLPARDFTIRHSTEIHVVRPDGSGLRRVSVNDAFAGSPSWSPDGTRLAFYTAPVAEVAKVTGARRLRGTTQIETLDLATGQRTVLTAGEGEKWSPRWVSEQVVAYVSGGPEGGVERAAGSPGARGAFSNPSWSPDGRTMVFHRDVESAWPPNRAWTSLDSRFRIVRTGIFPSYAPDGDRRVSNDQTAGILHNSILTMAADGTGATILFGQPDRSALGPEVSRDGRRIAFGLGQFFQNLNGPASADIATISVHGGDLRVLTDGQGNYGFPSWSPDGRQIVFRRAGGGENALEIIDTASGTRRLLLNGPAHYNFPSWSPTSNRIAFTADRDGDYEIWTIDADGSGLKRLTSSPGNDAHNSWSPDSKWIAFASARGGFKDEALLHPANPQPYGEIYVMRADGSEVHALTDDPFEKGTPAWRPLGRSASRRP
ncbi:TolB protein [Sphingomonas sp. UYAg733]